MKKKKKYNHLSQEQRYTIDRLLKQGKSQSEIAKIIGVHRSTVSREIARNKTASRGVYSWRLADQYAKERENWKKHPRKFTEAMRACFETLLIDRKWSPEQIANRCPMEQIPMVGKTALYTYLHLDKKNKGSLYLSCRHALRRRKQRLAAPTKWEKRKSISQRPICIDQQLREGDLEMDTIVGPNNKGAILTITDRKTGYLIMEKLKHGKDAKQLARVVNRRLAFLKRRGQIFSITTDNGTEFTHFKSIERALKIPVFFAKPYCSSDKPHIENINGLIRQYIPKGKSFDEISDDEIRQIQNQLNNRPRKKLGYKTPHEVFFLHL